MIFYCMLVFKSCICGEPICTEQAAKQDAASATQTIAAGYACETSSRNSPIQAQLKQQCME